MSQHHSTSIIKSTPDHHSFNRSKKQNSRWQWNEEINSSQDFSQLHDLQANNEVELELPLLTVTKSTRPKWKTWFGARQRQQFEYPTNNLDEKCKIVRTTTDSTCTVSTNSIFYEEKDTNKIEIICSRSFSEPSLCGDDAIELILQDPSRGLPQKKYTSFVSSKHGRTSENIGNNHLMSQMSSEKRNGGRILSSETSSEASLSYSEDSSLSYSFSAYDMELQDILDIVEILGSVRLDVSSFDGDSIETFDLEDILDTMKLKEPLFQEFSNTDVDRPIPREIFILK